MRKGDVEFSLIAADSALICEESYLKIQIFRFFGRSPCLKRALNRDRLSTIFARFKAKFAALSELERAQLMRLEEGTIRMREALKTAR